MSEMKRFRYRSSGSDSGDYIKYEDHEAKIAAAVQAAVSERDRLWCEALVSTGDARVIENVTKHVVENRPAPAVDVKAARNEIWAADLIVTMERLLHALEPCRGADFGLETRDSERLEAAIADAKRALVPPIRSLVAASPKAATATQDGGAR